MYIRRAIIGIPFHHYPFFVVIHSDMFKLARRQNLSWKDPKVTYSRFIRGIDYSQQGCSYVTFTRHWRSELWVAVLAQIQLRHHLHQTVCQRFILTFPLEEALLDALSWSFDRISSPRLRKILGSFVPESLGLGSMVARSIALFQGSCARWVVGTDSRKPSRAFENKYSPLARMPYALHPSGWRLH